MFPTFNTCSLRMISAIKSLPCTYQDILPLCERYKLALEGSAYLSLPAKMLPSSSVFKCGKYTVLVNTTHSKLSTTPPHPKTLNKCNDFARRRLACQKEACRQSLLAIPIYVTHFLYPLTRLPKVLSYN
ncbi:N-ethylmaleimide sensitive factor, vesicle fusing ATPase [Phyllostomus discolor]|uniref:N-ethylmaleimide sensitive factor, vesicle fusing ATPase n=1 Tax=Phyllostomus discolor TaxID=89673 RepID=A0A833ZL66_9CHIR|nr:N-ethylmaleimide sensitive factor, vesicle fusing ATPase [Phyllostomus discolor]